MSFDFMILFCSYINYHPLLPSFLLGLSLPCPQRSLSSQGCYLQSLTLSSHSLPSDSPEANVLILQVLALFLELPTLDETFSGDYIKPLLPFLFFKQFPLTYNSSFWHESGTDCTVSVLYNWTYRLTCNWNLWYSWLLFMFSMSSRCTDLLSVLICAFMENLWKDFDLSGHHYPWDFIFNSLPRYF